MLTRLVCLLALSDLCGSSPLGEFEKELKKEGVDLKKLHEELKKESAEVKEEFGGKGTQDELAKLRAAYHTCPAGSIMEKTELEINGDLAEELFEGDIVLTPEQWARAIDRDPTNPHQRRQAMTEAVRLWTPMGGPVIPYAYVDGFTEDKKPLIQRSLKFWEERTCVKFREATAADVNVVLFNHDSKVCSSSVGMVGKKQKVNLALGCMSLTVVTHEVAHAFGTLHVQSRSDRDNYVIVDFDNIQVNKSHNFLKEPKGYGVLDNYGIPYEFGSMQHYYDKAFAANTEKATIYTKPAFSQYQYSMEAPRASFYDTLLINKIYKCTDKCQKKIVCQNNGVQDGANCNRCFCPKGWTGTNCEKRPESAIMTKLTSNMKIQMDIPAGNGELQEKMYIIEAPTGKKIQAVVNRVTAGKGYDMCRTIGVEIVATKDTRPNGFRFCNTPDSTPIVSDSNTMLVWMYNEKAHALGAEIEFTLV